MRAVLNTGRPDPDYSAMTVNERLLTAGLVAAFDAAARSRDRDRMIEILKLVNVVEAERSVDLILANPREYGF